ncbi:TonB-dependent receptor domain-containing protein [Caulobacter sp. NIBR2454]|uniref:TonB-dependent receptor domain-containing protein n=1 Tax=Caulobacter sp. NIBR2454 TaxID=3015996 RepID=UPI0022B724F8|nr:TonB-dependent receptor [Caulobacter sp. NIBR2454]
MKFLSSRRRLFASTMMASAGLISAFAVQPAYAQAADENAVEEIIVTGSRIRRAETTTAAPVAVIDQQSIEDRGFIQIGQALNELTSNMPQFAMAAGSGSAAGTGQQFPNLFGLGAGRTLTLVNGRRFVTSSSGLGDRVVDTNIIPTGLIERVEVAQAGGAAVYGSDAISGVVNYVLRDDFDGLEVDLQYGISSRNDYETPSVRVTGGRNFADDRANVAFNLEWSKTDPLFDYDRPRSNLGRVTISNPANTSNADGIPAVVGNLNTRFVSFNANGVLFNPGPPFASSIYRVNGVPQQFNAAGTGLIAYDIGALLNPTVPPFTSGGDGNPYQELAALYAGVERWTATGVGSYELTDRIKLSGELLIARVEGTDPYGNQASNTVLNNAASGAGAISISRTNPYLSPAVTAVLGPAGAPLTLSKFWTDLLPTREVVTRTDTVRAALSLDGDFDYAGREFYWSLSFSHAETSGERTGYSVYTSRFNNAVNAVRNTQGQIVCAINADATTANDDANCAPINPFGVGNVSPQARAYATIRSGEEYLNTQDDFLATLGGDLFNLPAGAVKFSAAYEHRAENAKFVPLIANQQGLIGSQVRTAATSGKYNTDELSGELLVPVLGGDFTLPFARAVEFNGAFRHVDNSLAGKENIWGVGGRWEIFEGLSARVSRSRNFRAPTLDQQFAPQRTALGSIAQDPCDADRIAIGPAPAVRLANCRALFAANPGYGPLATFQDASENFSNANITTGGNPNLRNEISKTWTFGVVFQPTFVPGLSIVADRIEVDLKDGLSAFTPQSFLATCYDSVDQPEDICGTFTRDAQGNVVTALSTTFNAGKITFRGEVYNINYSFPIGRYFDDRDLGEVELNLEATRIEKFEISVTGVDRTRIDNTSNTPDFGPSPDLSAKFDARYRKGPFRFTYTANYLSPVKFTATSTIENVPTPNIKENLRHNVAAAYTFGEYTVGAGVTNLTDEEPSFPTRTYGDILGRRYFVALKARF